MAETVPAAIRLKSDVVLPPAATESEALAELKAIASKNRVVKSMIGMGYYETLTPGVILRNLLENPGANRSVALSVQAQLFVGANSNVRPRLQAGTHPTLRIRRKSARAASSHC